MTKKISLTMEIPADYRWVARQPYGTWMAFQNRPKIFLRKKTADGEKVEYWDQQEMEMELTSSSVDDYNKYEDNGWKDSLRRI